MNKILGPDKSAPIWYSASSKRGGKSDAPTKADKDRLTLNVPGNAKVRDVIEIIGDACGPEIAATFKNDSGEFIECCRIFVEGVLLDDLDAMISPNNDGQKNSMADIEIILLMANEAG